MLWSDPTDETERRLREVHTKLRRLGWLIAVCSLIALVVGLL
jgi:hypothetical protein